MSSEQHTRTTLQDLADELGAQAYELAAFMGWDSPTTSPDGYDPENLSEEMITEAREVWGHSSDGVYVPAEVRVVVSAHTRALELQEQQKAAAAERDQLARAAVASGHSVQNLADALGVDRQRVYAMTRLRGDLSRENEAGVERRDLEDVRECAGCEDSENAPHATDCPHR